MSVSGRESVSHEVRDDGGILYDVERSPSGGLTARFRVYGRVVIDGVEYEADRGEVRVKLTKRGER